MLARNVAISIEEADAQDECKAYGEREQIHGFAIDLGIFVFFFLFFFSPLFAIFFFLFCLNY
jgi:hypothetical protein